MLNTQPLRALILVCWLSSYIPVNYASKLEVTAGPTVTISQGTLLGTTLTSRYGRDIFAFLSIPYGEPPVGNLRFAKPVAAGGWDGILNVTTDATMCPQTVPFTTEFLGDENCLYVKVHTPKLPTTDDKSLLPVMVYIHGGSFRWELPAYPNPQYLLDEDVVLVSFNYRLGPLGFLATGDEVASGNWGMKDQVLALEWVRDNIQAFGGDADKVTIFGESGGSVSVNLLLLSETAEGLFHRYIAQSGSSLAPWGYQPRAVETERAFKLGQYVGCANKTSESLISCLRTINVSDIILTESQFVSPALQNFATIIWSPTDEPDIEGAFLTDSPTNLVKNGKIRSLPSMSGVTRDEGLAYTAILHANDEIYETFINDFDNLLPEVVWWTYQSDSGAAWIKATKEYYFNNDLTSNKTQVLENLTALVSDTFGNYPVYKLLRNQLADTTHPHYFYSFNYRGTESFSFILSGGSMENYGVSHADDLIYLFPKDVYFSSYNVTLSETDYDMVDIMVQLWTSFATNGKPTVPAACDEITWEPFSTEDNYLRIGNEADLDLKMQSSFLAERMRFWTELDAATDES